MNKEREKETILALYPNRFGLAFALFDNPQDLVDYGMNYIRPVSNRKTMRKVRAYLAYYKPDILVVRNVNDIKPKLIRRTKKLIDLICNEAKAQNLEVHSYNRTQIRNVFEQFGAKTKYQISKKIMGWYKQLKVYQFPKRKQSMEESNNTGVFDAVSIALTHWFLFD